MSTDAEMNTFAGHVGSIPTYAVVNKLKNQKDNSVEHVNKPEYAVVNESKNEKEPFCGRGDNIPEYAVVNKPAKGTALIVMVSNHIVV